ncbi:MULTISPECIES: hypothetical protein [Marinimicrobium]|jgi:uncharacterized membrane protein|uniref:Uncharacterized protein n=1 Tax=Marinimicrobium koreense TaxID=306545 RepID=A0A3N1P5Y0_9GAMM|nr:MULTISPECIES: hypothetical protein [Marinimicrobium]MAN51970.1 hypothetical protein [Marinimicrobium sp.]ROQ20226.1 hypothetical protein EDC38_0826 [Marinimicrobium koreense]|tara:strand:+ start:250 stop:480 length:231 start_codon:yes stop_codon:yes gene_type:complete
MKSFRATYRRYRTLWVSLLACAAFLALAVYGWGVSLQDLANTLWVAAVLLAGLIIAAAILGFVLFRVRRWRERRQR